MLALAYEAQSSVLPWHLPLSYTAVHGPTVLAAAPAAVEVVHAPAAVAVAPAVVPVAVEGSYVAKTRGAVHVAPLPGHANSAVSVNLQPAPGTI